MPATLVALMILIGVVVAVRATVLVPVRVTSSSMEPTLGVDDVVLVWRFPSDIADLRNGDLVVFDDPVSDRRTIKRIVGLPGQEVVILDGVLHVDRAPVVESWVDSAHLEGYYTRTHHVPPAHVFVLGDNRMNSVDSRDYGPVPVEDLRGRPLLWW